MSEGNRATILKQISVMASPSEVWEKLTTKQGLEDFFARNAEIDLREGGTATFTVSPTFNYSVKIVQVVPHKKLTWEEGLEQSELTVVKWTIETEDKGLTRIKMLSSGFGMGDEGIDWAWETNMRILKWSLDHKFCRQKYPYFGVRGGLIGSGFKVYDIVKDSPAEKVGLKPGDRIQGVGNHSLCGINWIAEVLSLYPPGVPLKIRVISDGEWRSRPIEIIPEFRYLEMGELDEA